MDINGSIFISPNGFFAWIFCMIRPTFLSPPLQSDEKSPGLRGWAYWAPPAHHASPWDGHFSSSQHIPTMDVEHEEQNKAMKTPISLCFFYSCFSIHEVKWIQKYDQTDGIVEEVHDKSITLKFSREGFFQWKETVYFCDLLRTGLVMLLVLQNRKLWLNAVLHTLRDWHILLQIAKCTNPTCLSKGYMLCLHMHVSMGIGCVNCLQTSRGILTSKNWETNALLSPPKQTNTKYPLVN